jgi:Zn-dependent protease with chaperone function
MHLGFVSHVRGNAVRLGPDQFPELHERVTLLAQRMGLERVPEAYLMQAGGSLNAFATRFLRSNMIVLFSDLLEQCGDNEAARDMIIAHELGHIRAGHLRWRWLIAPSLIVPFLGMALSRAREYTCDRIGAAGAGDRDGALLGLTILAAGGRYAPLVNREAFVAQRAAFATGWMTIGEWLSSHPPLAKRMVAIDPSLGVGRPASSAARAMWEQATGRPMPADPSDGFDYGYAVEGSTYLLWSSGPDGESATPDDTSATNR